MLHCCSNQNHPRTRWFAWILVWVGIAIGSTPYVHANPFQEKDDALDLRIVEQEPFDRIHLDELNDFRVLAVDPIKFEGLGATESIDPEDMDGHLEFTMPDLPGSRYGVPWANIVRVERYVEIVRKRLDLAMDQGRFDLAFRMISVLERRELRHLKKWLRGKMDACLEGDGAQQLAKGDYMSALFAFEALYTRNRNYRAEDSRPILEWISECIDAILQEKKETGQLIKVRTMLASFRGEYQQRLGPLFEKWDEVVNEMLRYERDQVVALLAEGDSRGAHTAVRRLIKLAPDSAEYHQLLADVLNKFPVVFVGVTQPALSADIRRLDNWAARRAGELTRQWLLQFVGLGDEGGTYSFPQGTVRRVDDQGLVYEFRFTDQLAPGVSPLSSFDLSNRLFDLADGKSPDCYLPWRRIVESIAISNDENRSVIVRLTSPHLRPESLLTSPLIPFHVLEEGTSDGKYRQIEKSAEESVFELNPTNGVRDGAQYPQVIEQTFANTGEATDALLRGEVDLVDRVLPGDIKRIKKDPDLIVRPYLVPTVHFLVPNRRTDFMKRDQFRRALQFAMNRNEILNDVFTGGQQIEGYEILTGPFPLGSDSSSELSYAYDTKIKPRDFSTKLAIVLIEHCKSLIKAKLERDMVINPVVEIPTLILAYPNTGSVESACRAIAAHWKRLDVEVELRALPPGVSRPDDDEWDILYCEVQIQEPLADAHQIFGENGLVKTVDPTILQALRVLDRTNTWTKAGTALRRIHQQASNNLAIFPLWQIPEYYAYQKNLINVGNELTYLYQHVDRWKIGSSETSTEQER